jgi:hypothetical protein
LPSAAASSSATVGNRFSARSDSCQAIEVKIQAPGAAARAAAAITAAIGVSQAGSGLISIHCPLRRPSPGCAPYRAFRAPRRTRVSQSRAGPGASEPGERRRALADAGGAGGARPCAEAISSAAGLAGLGTGTRGFPQDGLRLDLAVADGVVVGDAHRGASEKERVVAQEGLMVIAEGADLAPGGADFLGESLRSSEEVLGRPVPHARFVAGRRGQGPRRAPTTRLGARTGNHPALCGSLRSRRHNWRDRATDGRRLAFDAPGASRVPGSDSHRILAGR